MLYTLDLTPTFDCTLQNLFFLARLQHLSGDLTVLFLPIKVPSSQPLHFCL